MNVEWLTLENGLRLVYKIQTSLAMNSKKLIATTFKSKFFIDYLHFF